MIKLYSGLFFSFPYTSFRYLEIFLTNWIGDPPNWVFAPQEFGIFDSQLFDFCSAGI